MREQGLHLPPRLIFEGDRGFYEYGRCPYKFFYRFDNEDSPALGLSKQKPAHMRLTPDMPIRGGGNRTYSLSVWIHESVPKEFIDVVMFHEFREAELHYANHLDSRAAHLQSRSETFLYARQYLSEDGYQRFLEWDRQLDFLHAEDLDMNESSNQQD